MDIKANEINKHTFIDISNNGFEISLCSLGASICYIKDEETYLTLPFSNVNDFFKNTSYHGKSIGRVANRIKGNKLVINDKTYILENNEGNNTLHGGVNGISTKDFSYSIRKNASKALVKFYYLSPNLESGFPGNILFEIDYYIDSLEKTIKLKFFASTDMDTPIYLTNHTYFTLGENLDSLSLKIKADKYLEVDPNSLLAKRICDVTKSLDFTKTKAITKDIYDPKINIGRLNGYDHHYYFSKVSTRINQIELTGKKYKMIIKTDYSGAQIYSDSFEDDILFLGYENKNRYRAIAIEPQDRDIVLKNIQKGCSYNRFIKYKFIKP